MDSNEPNLQSPIVQSELSTKVINVTKTYLPCLSEYVALLQGVWDRNWVTNNGPLVLELERTLRDYLSLPMVHFVSNGTIALQLALRALEITKSVITTPFSYVATTTSILWEHCNPVFVDIEENTFCIDPEKIEAAVTKDTQAILATHVYGYPCAVNEIQRIADKHGLRVIYDAAHAFGTKLGERSILSYGDLSTVSFHATKIFHTIEGGAIVANTDELYERLLLLKSFGHKQDEYHLVGINGKNSEFHAAMGLCLLPKVDGFIKRRKQISELYDGLLSGIGLRFPQRKSDFDYNYSYYPIVFNSEEALLLVLGALEKEGVYTRRYFYPSLNTLPYVVGARCAVSEYIAARVLCLPLFVELDDSDVVKISEIVRNNVRQVE